MSREWRSLAASRVHTCVPERRDVAGGPFESGKGPFVTTRWMGMPTIRTLGMMRETTRRAKATRGSPQKPGWRMLECA